ncbi:MAG: DUF2079 domain-containing protein [bacterium]|nr:DUF2079 domain-containing protein [bacterium]
MQVLSARARSRAWLHRHVFPLALALSYAAIFFWLSWLRHITFHTQAWDLGIFEQSFWNTLSGRIMDNNFEFANHLSVHFSPFLFLLVPWYALWPGPAVLLALQALALGSAVIPLYRLASRWTGKTPAHVICGVYLLYPPLHWLNLFDFHEVAFAIPLLLWAVDLADQDRRRWAAVVLALAAGTAENIVLVAAAVGLFWLLTKRPRWFGATVTAACLAYFLLVANVVMPALGGKIYRLDRYANLGGNAGEILATVLTDPALVATTVTRPEKISYLAGLLVPLAGFSLLAPAALVLAIPGLAMNLLTDYAPQFSGRYQYDAVLIPGLLVAAISGLRLVTKKFPARTLLILLVLGGASLGGFLWWSPLGLRAYPWTQLRTDRRSEIFAQLLEKIPPDASIAAATNLVPHLTHRRGIWMAGSEPRLADIVIVDMWDRTGFAGDEQFRTYLANYLERGYQLQRIAQRILILTPRSP